MPSRSEKQRRAMGAALSAKRGRSSPSSLKGASKSMYESMTEKQLAEFSRKPTKRMGKSWHTEMK